MFSVRVHPTNELCAVWTIEVSRPEPMLIEKTDDEYSDKSQALIRKQ
jgi:hypothetical protein